MNNRPTTEKEIFEALSTIIVEALRIDSERIKMDARLFLDLDAESIDILDIRFRLEELLGFKIDQKDLINSLGENLTATEIMEQFTVKRLINYLEKQIHQHLKTA